MVAKGDDIEERLIDFAVCTIGLCGRLPKNEVGAHIAGQLTRCGTAPAAHYGEARGAESRKDFIHKLRPWLKELNETRVWLKIVDRSGLHPSQALEPILQENGELCRIINASIQTTASKWQ